MPVLQSNFTRGEIDPQLVGRVDLSAYYAGVKTATNMLCIPQGGMKKRPGQEYVADAEGDGRLELFSYDEDTEYLLAFSNTKMQVFKDGALVTNINGSGNDYLTIPHTAAQIADMDYIQSVNTILLFHEDVQTRKIVRGATDATWTLTAVTYDNIPQYDFNDSKSPTPVSQVQQLVFTNAAESDRFKLSLNGILTDEIVHSGKSNAGEQAATEKALLEGLKTHPLLNGTEIAVAYDSLDKWNITFSGGNADAWSILTASPILTASTSFKTNTTITTEGTARKENVWSNGDDFSVSGATQADPCVVTTSATHNFVEGDSVGFDSVGGMTELNGNYYRVANPTATTFELEGIDSSGYGAYTSGGTATGAGRGWPRTATFHEGRLWLGGSKSRVNTLWGSVVAEFFNFDIGKSLDDQAVIATLDTDQVNQIQAIYSNRSLQIFTTGAEFYIPQRAGDPITPASIAVLPQTRFGSKRVRPVTLNGRSYFVQRNGKVLNQFLYLDEIQSNAADPVSILAAHLINSPSQMAVKRGDGTSDVNYIYLVGNDGNLTVFNTVPSEAIQGFTSWQTEGNIKSVAVVDDTLYLLVERTINSSTVYYIEKENANCNTDACTYNTSLGGSTFTGLDQLEAEEVVIKLDGANQPKDTVSSGQVTLLRSATIAEAGLEYTPTLKTMPLNMDLQNGPIVSKKKRIKRCNINLYESNGVIINGERIADKTIGQNQFDAPDPYTGEKRIYLGGWSIEADVTITQDTPMPLQVLRLNLEVAF